MSRFLTALLMTLLSGGLLALCHHLPAHADAEDNLQVWNPVNISGELTPKVPVNLEIQPRTQLAGPRESNPNDFSLLILRPSVGYQLNKQVSVWAGYGWTPSFNPAFRNENRIFQQLQINNEFKHFSLSNRTRLEQRLIEDTDGQAALRARHMIRVMVPVGKSKNWRLVAANEGFLNLNSVPDGPRAGIDQNRAFVGINRKINRHMNVEAGYLHNYVHRRSSRNRINHVLLLGLNIAVN